QGRIPLLAEEGWRAAPGWSVRLKRFAGLTTPSAPSLRSAHPPLLCEEGNTRLELHPLSRAGMAETQIFAVKCKPANGIRAAAVNFVADDREALLGEMNTDLMLAPGFQLHANQARFRTAFHNLQLIAGMLTRSFLRG